MAVVIADGSKNRKIVPPLAWLQRWVDTYPITTCTEALHDARSSTSTTAYTAVNITNDLLQRERLEFTRLTIMACFRMTFQPISPPATKYFSTAPVELNLGDIYKQAGQVLRTGLHRGLYSLLDYNSNLEHLRECVGFSARYGIFQELPRAFSGQFEVSGGGLIREQYALLEVQVTLLYWQSSSSYGKEKRFFGSLGMFRRAIKTALHQAESLAMAAVAKTCTNGKKARHHVSHLSATSPLCAVTKVAESLSAKSPNSLNSFELSKWSYPYSSSDFASSSSSSASPSGFSVYASSPYSSSSRSSLGSYAGTISRSLSQSSQSSQMNVR
ncbi:MAG: hypothetical protein SEPTF4163_000236 [Sporothrix epigloea]